VSLDVAPSTAVDLAERVRVLGDPLRARIVSLLASSTMCTCHLVEDTGAAQTTVSHHLRVLRDAGWVDTEPCGRFTYYRLRPDPLRALAEDLVAVADAAVGAAGRKRPC
jgi:ArsR family transcriptional regulator